MKGRCSDGAGDKDRAGRRCSGEDRGGGGTGRGGGAAALSRGQAKSGQAHHRQRAVLEAAALGADGEGGRGRQSGGRAAGQRLAGELHPQQARGRHGLLSGADGAAPGAGRPAGGRDAEPYPASAAEKRPVQADVFQGVVGQAEVRVRRVRRVLGQRKAARAGRREHPQHGRAEPVLGAGGHGHTGVGALFLHGAGAQQPSGAEVAGAGGEAGARRRAGEPVSVRRQGGHVGAVAGGGLVLPHGA